jgi:hypothetical protein
MIGPIIGTAVLKDAVAACAAPARDMAIASTARVLTSFVALFIGNGCRKDRDMARSELIY